MESTRQFIVLLLFVVERELSEGESMRGTKDCVCEWAMERVWGERARAIYFILDYMYDI